MNEWAFVLVIVLGILLCQSTIPFNFGHLGVLFIAFGALGWAYTEFKEGLQ